MSMNAKMGQSTVGEMLPYFIIIGILLLFFVFCIRMISITSRAKNQQKAMLQQMRKNGLTINAVFNHVNGLPIAENVMCEVNSYPDKLEFKSGAMQFNLAKDKITDITMKTDVEIQKQYVSSIGGAVGGAVLFGPLGAMIGGRAKAKKTKTVLTYLLITFKNEDEIKYIGFDVTNSFMKASKFVSEFAQNNNTITSIDL